jgi:hypothetical protein
LLDACRTKQSAGRRGCGAARRRPWRGHSHTGEAGMGTYDTERTQGWVGPERAGSKRDPDNKSSRKLLISLISAFEIRVIFRRGVPEQLRLKFRPCLVPKKSQNFLHSNCHIESLDVCMEH